MKSTELEKELIYPVQDFRSKATFGITIAAALVMLPTGLYDLYIGQIAIGIGALAVVFALLINACLVRKGRCHQKLTAYGLIPAGMVFMTSVFQMDGVIASFWCFPVVLAAYCMLSERRAWITNIIILIIALPMAWTTLDTAYASHVTASLFSVSLFTAIMVNVIDEQRRQLQYQLVLDPLTGLLNRLTFNSCMEQAVKLHVRNQQPVSLLAIDIDHFKQLNDNYGHAVGDKALTMMGKRLRETVRDEDTIFRMGGEEFTVVLKGANKSDALETAERLRLVVDSAPFGNIRHITISVGVAEHLIGESWESWAKRADDCLYEAKHGGRNQVASSLTRTVEARQPIQLISLT